MLTIDFAVVDVETTGLFPNRADRVIEIAVRRLRPDGTLREEFATLVNPGRDVGATSIHGIRAADLVSAPSFHEIAGDVADCLHGAVCVGHNVRFDATFLVAEFCRLGVPVPDFPTLCTLKLAYEFGPPLASRRLADCCAAFGIDRDGWHCAYDDACATSELLVELLRRAREAGSDPTEPLAGCVTDWRSESLVRTGKRVTRRQAANLREEGDRQLCRVIERLAEPLHEQGCDVRHAQYLETLDRVMDDRIVTPDEAEGLYQIAEQFNLDKGGVLSAHRTYLRELCRAALADDHLSDCEMTDIRRVALLLGLSEKAIEDEIASARADRPSTIGSGAVSLQGKTVCFTGELVGRIGGEAIARERAHELATQAGLVVKSNISKALDMLVVADPHSQSGKAKKARQYGVRIVAEPTFWKLIQASVD